MFFYESGYLGGVKILFLLETTDIGISYTCLLLLHMQLEVLAAAEVQIAST